MRIGIKARLSDALRRKIYIEDARLLNISMADVDDRDLTEDEREFLYDHFDHELTAGIEIDVTFSWMDHKLNAEEIETIELQEERELGDASAMIARARAGLRMFRQRQAEENEKAKAKAKEAK